jgi:cell wall-associated NlpC family hydrolase
MDIMAIIRGLLAGFMGGGTQTPIPAPTPSKTDPEPSQAAPSIDWAKFKELATEQLGKDYVFGVEDDGNSNPTQFDCSELVQWLYAEIGITVPDGSMNQFEESDPVDEPKLGDVGFFRKPGMPTHHVGIIYDDMNVIEARGFQQSLENEGVKSNCVLLRPRYKWEAFSEFTGWRRLRAVKEIEG